MILFLNLNAFNHNINKSIHNYILGRNNFIMFFSNFIMHSKITIDFGKYIEIKL
jgi:hypothetical protein